MDLAEISGQTAEGIGEIESGIAKLQGVIADLDALVRQANEIKGRALEGIKLAQAKMASTLTNGKESNAG